MIRHAAFARGPGPADGFALIETLASLVIVSMIAMMLLAGVHTGRRVWERIDTREASGETVDAAQDLLRDRLEKIFPQTLYDQNPPYIDFRGEADKATFLANPPDAGRPAPIRRYTLWLDTAGELVLDSVNDAEDIHLAKPIREVLLTGVRQLDLAYFGAAQPDYSRHWRPAWRGSPTLPDVVRVRLAFEPADARQWPDLMIHPRPTIDSACLLNPVTNHCKGRL